MAVQGATFCLACDPAQKGIKVPGWEGQFELEPALVHRMHGGHPPQYVREPARAQGLLGIGPRVGIGFMHDPERVIRMHHELPRLFMGEPAPAKDYKLEFVGVAHDPIGGGAGLPAVALRNLPLEYVAAIERKCGVCQGKVGPLAFYIGVNGVMCRICAETEDLLAKRKALQHVVDNPDDQPPELVDKFDEPAAGPPPDLPPLEDDESVVEEVD